MIGLIIILATGALIAAWEYATYRSGGVPTIASFAPSQRVVLDILTQATAAHTGPAPFTIIDLGSGNGQIATKIARALPNVKVTGLEISWMPYGVSKLRQRLFGPANLEFRRENFWSYDCSKTDAVFFYLDGPIIKRIGEKLRTELKPGALIVSNEIALQGNWQPVETIDTKFFNTKIFVYRQTDRGA